MSNVENEISSFFFCGFDVFGFSRKFSAELKVLSTAGLDFKGLLRQQHEA